MLGKYALLPYFDRPVAVETTRTYICWHMIFPARDPHVLHFCEVSSCVVRGILLALQWAEYRGI